MSLAGSFLLAMSFLIVYHILFTHAPFSHHILLTHAQSSLTHDKPMVLTEALLQVNGLGVDFAGMERAALSTALTQVPGHPINCDHLATWLT